MNTTTRPGHAARELISRASHYDMAYAAEAYVSRARCRGIFALFTVPRRDAGLPNSRASRDVIFSRD